MTYFLVKTLPGVDEKSLASGGMWDAHIRPCAVNYKQVLKSFNSFCGTIILEGCIAEYKPQHDGSLEQWLVTLATDKGIMPDFEQHMIQHNDHCYIAKTIDLKTGKVLEDATDRILKKIRGETDVTYGIHIVEYDRH